MIDREKPVVYERILGRKAGKMLWERGDIGHALAPCLSIPATYHSRAQQNLQRRH
jgi:hypothetical protein